MRCYTQNTIYFKGVVTMRIRISDEIIEIAKKHQDVNERMGIYGKAAMYAIEKVVVDDRMAEYLDPNLRRKEKMKWKQNRLGHTIIKSGTHLKKGVGQTKNKCGTDLNLSVGHTKKPKSKTTQNQITDDALTIYISNNNLLYSIVCNYIDIDNGNIQYLINKQWKDKYIYSQMLEAEKVIKKIWLQNFKDILNYIKNDDFRSKQILSIAKLNRKNKEWVPYYIVIKDKMRPQQLMQQRQQREIELHRQRVAEQIQSFKSEITEDEQNGNQKGNYNRRQNISFD